MTDEEVRAAALLAAAVACAGQYEPEYAVHIAEGRYVPYIATGDAFGV